VSEEIEPKISRLDERTGGKFARREWSKMANNRFESDSRPKKVVFLGRTK
jgi:hypothetical protein